MAPSKPTVLFPHGATIKIPMRTPWDLTGYTIASTIKDDFGLGRAIASFTTTVQINPKTSLLGLLLLTLAADLAAELTPGQGDYAFDVKLTAPNGDVEYLPFVSLLITPTGTP